MPTFPPTQEADVKRTVVQDKSEKKVRKNQFQSTSQVFCLTGRICVKASLGKSTKPYMKNNEAKMSWGCGSIGRIPA
jgi:hypothetical protein